jgi:hypothetical protein
MLGAISAPAKRAGRHFIRRHLIRGMPSYWARLTDLWAFAAGGIPAVTKGLTAKLIWFPGVRSNSLAFDKEV